MSMKLDRAGLVEVSSNCQTLTGVNKSSIEVFDNLVREVFNPGNVTISGVMKTALNKFDENTEVRKVSARTINSNVREALCIFQSSCKDLEIDFTMPLIED